MEGSSQDSRAAGRRENTPMQSRAGCAWQSWVDKTIADEGQVAAVRRPRRNVDRTLTAKQLGEYLNLASAHGYYSQHHIFVGRMALDTLVEGDESDPLTVWRGMRKPVV